MSILVGILGLIVTIAIAFLLSNDKKGINFKAIIVLFVLEFIVALIMFKTTVGLKIVEATSNGVSKVLSYGNEGVNFV
ncbi:MAG: Na+ dependent nucleoside transporter N-terminal domain-containing protein, partial [Niallia sp.]